MSKGKKILLGIVIIVIGIFTLQIVNYQTASDEQKEQWAAESEEEDREKRGLLLKTARDIEPSKLSESWGQYKINAGNILSKYVLEYQGKDRSGKSLVSQLNDLNDEFN